MERRKREAVEEVEKAGLYELERKRVALDKVRRRFFGHLLTGPIELKGIRTPLFVRSMRCEDLSPEIVSELEELRAQVAEEAARATGQHMAGKIARKGRAKSMMVDGDDIAGLGEEQSRQKQSKHDVWRLARLARQRRVLTARYCACSALSVLCLCPCGAVACALISQIAVKSARPPSKAVPP